MVARYLSDFMVLKKSVSGINPEFQKSLPKICDIVEMKIVLLDRAGKKSLIFGVEKNLGMSQFNQTSDR